MPNNALPGLSDPWWTLPRPHYHYLFENGVRLLLVVVHQFELKYYYFYI